MVTEAEAKRCTNYTFSQDIYGNPILLNPVNVNDLKRLDERVKFKFSAPLEDEESEDIMKDSKAMQKNRLKIAAL